MSDNFQTQVKVSKVSEELGLVFGFGMICKQAGEEYFDTQGDAIPEASMLEAATDFMLHSGEAREMHEEGSIGQVVFAFPLTTEIAKAFDITTPRTGLMIAMRPTPDVLAKFKSGEYTGFSIGGRRIEEEVVEP